MEGEIVKIAKLALLQVQQRLQDTATTLNDLFYNADVGENSWQHVDELSLEEFDFRLGNLGCHNADNEFEALVKVVDEEKNGTIKIVKLEYWLKIAQLGVVDVLDETTEVEAVPQGLSAASKRRFKSRQQKQVAEREVQRQLSLKQRLHQQLEKKEQQQRDQKQKEQQQLQKRRQSVAPVRRRGSIFDPSGGFGDRMMTFTVEEGADAHHEGTVSSQLALCSRNTVSRCQDSRHSQYDWSCRSVKLDGSLSAGNTTISSSLPCGPAWRAAVSGPKNAALTSALGCGSALDGTVTRQRALDPPALPGAIPPVIEAMHESLCGTGSVVERFGIALMQPPSTTKKGRNASCKAELRESPRQLFLGPGVRKYRGVPAAESALMSHVTPNMGVEMDFKPALYEGMSGTPSWRYWCG